MTGVASAADLPERRRDLIGSLLTPGGFAVAWALYVLANAAIRYFFSHTLSTDDAPASLLVQTFQLGYELKHPPLWEWLLWSIQQIVGPGFISHHILRYGAIFLLGIAIFRACRAVSGDTRWSAAVALASPLVYQMGWPFFEWGTHSLLLASACLFSVEAAMRYIDRPSLGRAVLLGLFVGFGFLAKYGYAIFLAGLLFAMLTQPASRSALLRPYILVVPLAAVLVLSPYLTWLVSTDADLVGMAGDNLIDADISHWQRVLDGLAAFTFSAVKFVVPWPFILAFALWQARRRHPAPAAPADLGERIAGLTFFFSIALTAVGIVAFGITKMTGGYVIPILIMLLPWSTCLLTRLYSAPDGARHLAMIGLAALLVVTLIRLFYLGNSGFPENSYRREMWPIAGLAGAMRDAGVDNGTLVVAGWRDAGSLRAALPQTRVVRLRQTRFRPPPPAEAAPCRLIWNDSAALWPDERWARGEDRATVEALPQYAGRAERHFDIPWGPTFLGTPRVSRWSMIDLDPTDPLCR